MGWADQVMQPFVNPDFISNRRRLLSMQTHAVCLLASVAEKRAVSQRSLPIIISHRICQAASCVSEKSARKCSYTFVAFWAQEIK